MPESSRGNKASPQWQSLDGYSCLGCDGDDGKKQDDSAL